MNSYVDGLDYSIFLDNSSSVKSEDYYAKIVCNIYGFSSSCNKTAGSSKNLTAFIATMSNRMWDICMFILILKTNYITIRQLEALTFIMIGTMIYNKPAKTIKPNMILSFIFLQYIIDAYKKNIYN